MILKENKGWFKITEKRYSFNWERGHPNFWDNYCDLADCYLTCEDVCELLNELDSENQKLTKENEELKKDNNELENEIEKLENRLWNCQNVRWWLIWLKTNKL